MDRHNPINSGGREVHCSSVKASISHATLLNILNDTIAGVIIDNCLAHGCSRGNIVITDAS